MENIDQLIGDLPENRPASPVAIEEVDDDDIYAQADRDVAFAVEQGKVWKDLLIELF